MIKVENVKKYYKLGETTVKAVDDVSFEIAEEEFVALLGPSGSGKSTLMHLLGGLDDTDSGIIEVFGDNISNYSDEEQARYRNSKIGFVFQTFNLQPTLTALENVELPLKFSKIDKKERMRKAKEALRTVGLEKRMHHKPGELSGGERQRVSVARAIVNNPTIILADEPTGNLDTKTGKSIMELLARLNKEQKITVFYITHSEDHAKYADRILQIIDGKLVK